MKSFILATALLVATATVAIIAGFGGAAYIGRVLMPLFTLS